MARITNRVCRKKICILTVHIMAGLLSLYQVACADELGSGRLFFSEKERVGLDALRKTGKPPQVLAAKKKKKELPPPPRIKVNGLVIRSNGKNVAWLNGVQVDADSSGQQQGMRVDVHSHAAQGEVEVHIASRNRSILLKPGQSADTVDFKAVEGDNPDETRIQQIPTPQVD